MKNTGFWDKTPCSLTQNCKGFVGIIWSHLQDITEHSTETDESNKYCASNTHAQSEKIIFTCNSTAYFINCSLFVLYINASVNFFYRSAAIW